MILVDDLFRVDPMLMTKLYYKLNEFNGNIILLGRKFQIKHISD